MSTGWSGQGHTAPEFLSTRIFPKGQGALAYNITGIANCCDWVITSDNIAPQAALVHIRNTDTPHHIFISLRNPLAAFDYFFDEVLPQLKSPFLLITGSSDQTVPNQIDKRWPAYPASLQARLIALCDHPLLRHWFAENLTDNSHSKLSALPLGLLEPTPLKFPAFPPLKERPFEILCAHRLREGSQWLPRQHVSELATTDWARWCTVPDQELSLADFTHHVQNHRFVLCVEGGGLDPSPKAWQAILNGTIPIIRRTAASTAYHAFPVAIVDSWNATEITEKRLSHWLEKAETAWNTNPNLILERLSLDYWWHQIIG